MVESENFQTVSDLTDAIKFTLNSDFADVWVTGEVSGLVRPRSGHLYFTLKDTDAQISAVMWRSAVARLKFAPENGMQILCRGYVDVYAQRGNYQLIANVIQPVGEGSLQIAFRKLHERLKSEGLFDDSHKTPVPAIPQRVVLITSPNGAAARDFLKVVSRRWQNLDILIAPVEVQGSNSSRQIANAVKFFGSGTNPFKPDVMVVTRGGGSIEDLWSFNEEPVVRAIYEANVPVISAVGHEIDVSLSDLVADMRAATPSEAAEKLVPDQSHITAELNASGKRLWQAINERWRQCHWQASEMAKRQVLRRPLYQLRQQSIELDAIESRLVGYSKNMGVMARQRLARQAERLQSALGAATPRLRNQLDLLAQSNAFKRPLEDLERRRLDLKTKWERLNAAIEKIFNQAQTKTEMAAGKLQAFNPTDVLKRGYSLTVDRSGTPITDCNNVASGDTIDIWLSKGKISGVVNETDQDAEYFE